MAEPAPLQTCEHCGVEWFAIHICPVKSKIIGENEEIVRLQARIAELEATIVQKNAQIRRLLK